MKNVHEVIQDSIDSLDSTTQTAAWSFLNLVKMGIAPKARLNDMQINLLETIINGVLSGKYEDVPGDNLQTLSLAMKTVQLVNGAHVANQAP